MRRANSIIVVIAVLGLLSFAAAAPSFADDGVNGSSNSPGITNPDNSGPQGMNGSSGKGGTGNPGNNNPGRNNTNAPGAEGSTGANGSKATDGNKNPSKNNTNNPGVEGSTGSGGTDGNKNPSKNNTNNPGVEGSTGGRSSGQSASGSSGASTSSTGSPATAAANKDRDNAKQGGAAGRSGPHAGNDAGGGGKPAPDMSGKSSGPAEKSPPGNNGTIKVHDQGPRVHSDVEVRRNEPHVSCTFHLYGFHFDKGQSGSWRIVAWSPTGDRETQVASGSWTASQQGDWQSGPITLSEGHYKLYFGTFNGHNKHKVFWVDGCAPPPPDEEDDDKVGGADKVWVCHITGSGWVKIHIARAGWVNGHSKHEGDVMAETEEGLPESCGVVLGEKTPPRTGDGDTGGGQTIVVTDRVCVNNILMERTFVNGHLDAEHAH